MIEAINRKIRGWTQFHRHAMYTGVVYQHIDTVIFWKLAHWLARRHKGRIRQTMRKWYMPAGEYQASCSDFSTNVSTLRPGTYVGTARLIGSGGQPRTTTLQMNPFAIVSGSTLVIDIDFPASSFQ